MVTETTDRRVRRTRELLRGALISLLTEKSYDQITVQDVLDRADVGRSTFYAHFRDKDELLRSGFDALREGLVTPTERDNREAGPKSEFLPLALAVFRHVDGHRSLYRVQVRKGQSAFVLRLFRDVVTELVREDVRSRLGPVGANPEKIEAAAQFVSSALAGLCIWWLEGDVGYSAEELHSIFRGLTTQGVRRFLAQA